MERSSKLELACDYTDGDLMSRQHILGSFEEFCCRLIQRWWRKILAEKSSKTHELAEGDSKHSLSEQNSSNSKLLWHTFPNFEFGTGYQSIKSSDLEAAAIIIQRSWRRHVDMQVFKYYKDFISFNSVGEPVCMLKSINPKESQLIDPASGLRVRFRLGGEIFPPNVYYKIVTTRNVADIGAFAPRDYTAPQSKALPMKYIHNKVDRIDPQESGKRGHGWYNRSENNGWRIVSDKMIAHSYQDSVTFSTSINKSQFHHSKIVRRDALEKKRKQKKIAWLKKMYRDGAEEDKEGQIHSLINSTAQGIFKASEAGFEVSVEDWEVDELLKWTNTLNFDQYLSDWKDLGTTSSSSLAESTNKL